jgi:hypothetical protein
MNISEDECCDLQMDLKSLSFPSLEQPTGWKPEIEQVKR